MSFNDMEINKENTSMLSQRFCREKKKLLLENSIVFTLSMLVLLQKKIDAC